MLLLPCETLKKKQNLPNWKTLLSLDVTNSEQIKTTVPKAISLHTIDVVFNNVGYGLMGATEAFSDEQILKQINTILLIVIRN